MIKGTYSVHVNHEFQLSPGGNLNINVHSAVKLLDTETFSKIDPFCEVEYQGKKVKTKFLPNAGQNPVWNESFDFIV